MNSRNNDGRAMMPLTALPFSEEQVLFTFLSLDRFPAVEYDADLSSSLMVQLNASLLIANQLPIGDKKLPAPK